MEQQTLVAKVADIAEQLVMVLVIMVMVVVVILVVILIVVVMLILVAQMHVVTHTKVEHYEWKTTALLF